MNADTITVMDSSDAKYFSCIRLFSADVVIAGRPGHPLAGATSLQDLAQAKWISGASRGREEPVLPAMFSRLGLGRPNYVASRESFSALMILLLQTDCLATVSRCSIAPFVQSGMLFEFSLQERLPPVVFNMYSKEGRILGKLGELAAAEFRKAARAHRR